ncbi:TetR/AcrR family transcriptional regulator [Candidatus Obscuribacterales bacterium]|nr:TetR/AcrR family transcriptional regulator [Candidatus Obscuribacterales bacterium]MBX3138287.1 TetR/AcrR family transcriptional regulator [Candidatus Obscuribacterales bacterium]
MKTQSKASTREHILNVAERHFANFGYAGTSLRGIIKGADVNVAAIAYHFGDKEDLFVAVVERFAAPVVEEQLKRLDEVLVRKRVKLVDVIQAFYEPPIRMVKKRGKSGEVLAQFLGRAQMEPEPVYTLVDKNFAACRNRFIDAFRRVNPALEEADYEWRFEFMLSLIVCFLTRQKLIRERYGDSSEFDVDEALMRLTDFALSGLSGAPGRS